MGKTPRRSNSPANSYLEDFMDDEYSKQTSRFVENKSGNNDDNLEGHKQNSFKTFGSFITDNLRLVIIFVFVLGIILYSLFK